ncbi:MAG: GyrI-like domain-containing protein [Halanaeroarchaeum sp.]
MQAPDIVDRSAFTVAGHHYEGTNQDGELAECWRSVADDWADLLALAADDRAYGVSYGGDPEAGTFEYLAGVRVAADANVPETVTAVDVPASTYAVFETTLAAVDETMQYVHREWLPDAEYDLAMGPEVERYADPEAAGDPGATFTISVPIG